MRSAGLSADASCTTGTPSSATADTLRAATDLDFASSSSKPATATYNAHQQSAQAFINVQ